MSRIYRKTRKVKLIEQMQTISLKSKNPLHRRDAGEVVQYFIRNGYMPNAMSHRCAELVKLNKELFPKFRGNFVEEPKRHYLYAIQCGDRLKVGYSVSPKKRLNRMQTGNAEEMKIVWRIYVAEDPKEARRQEKKLHRFLKRYKIRGEWFDAECVDLVKGWRIRNREAKDEAAGQEVNQSLDAEFAAIIG